MSPVAPYLGGKRNLASRIIERIAKVPHDTYVEPFIGMGGVFLRRPFRAKGEVINDVSRDISNLFRILQRHYVPLMDMLRFQLTSRADFQRLLETNAESLTDLERAARFLYLQRTRFGGKPTERIFGVAVGQSARFDVSRLGPMLDEVHQRLSGVVIECLPYARLISTYDRPQTLFYLDPPYWGCENDYGKCLFSPDDFGRIADLLGSLKGRFIMSINDVPEIREIFGRFRIEKVTTTYSVGLNKKRAAELLISSI
ncbi:DNA adenine methylase [Gluconacetobacter entanii]|uniref:DNA adenine methylase n=1 Tax=Gluconacetobacter entanii TaxID=108528 RepID=UPI00223626EA|nr:DNA adenine methylase [Gluconacetobacter entanii]MCW4581231.1 DNA adenine methylase [Gluconacetobacter entanii]MCW4584491.1 DNA adenine methylase [Gluconacetobacter entanii]MCW4587845.1 DNA adenine methylase [Gluconacetobacter entanii]